MRFYIGPIINRSHQNRGKLLFKVRIYLRAMCYALELVLIDSKRQETPLSCFYTIVILFKNHILVDVALFIPH